MFLVRCPICDYSTECPDSADALSISKCPKCGFDFQSNRCSNPECRKPLHFSKSFCSSCGYESDFYINCYDVHISLKDELF